MLLVYFPVIVHIFICSTINSELRYISRILLVVGSTIIYNCTRKHKQCIAYKLVVKISFEWFSFLLLNTLMNIFDVIKWNRHLLGILSNLSEIAFLCVWKECFSKSSVSIGNLLLTHNQVFVSTIKIILLKNFQIYKYYSVKAL